MEHITTAKAAVMAGAAAVGGVMGRLYGDWTSAMTTLLIFMAIDYAMGLIVAGVFKNSDKTEGGGLSSRVCWQGLWRKGVTLLVVLVAARLDITLGTSIVRDAVVLAYIANETISIMESAGLMGVPWPEPIRNALEQLQGKEHPNGNRS